MLTLELWLTFILACLLISLSPSNGAVLTMSHGLGYGLRGTLPTILGLQTGLLLVALISGLGVGALLLASPLAFATLRLCGAAYLIWLGVGMLLRRAHQLDIHGATQTLSARQRFVQGFLTNTTNPKGVVFLVAVLPQFISVEAHWPQRLMELLLLCATMIAIDLVVMHGYALLAEASRRLLRSPVALLWLERSFGLALALVGLSLLFYATK